MAFITDFDDNLISVFLDGSFKISDFAFENTRSVHICKSGLNLIHLLKDFKSLSRVVFDESYDEIFPNLPDSITIVKFDAQYLKPIRFPPNLKHLNVRNFTNISNIVFPNTLKILVVNCNLIRLSKFPSSLKIIINADMDSECSDENARIFLQNYKLMYHEWILASSYHDKKSSCLKSHSFKIKHNTRLKKLKLIDFIYDLE